MPNKNYQEVEEIIDFLAEIFDDEEAKKSEPTAYAKMKEKQASAPISGGGAPIPSTADSYETYYPKKASLQDLLEGKITAPVDSGTGIVNVDNLDSLSGVGGTLEDLKKRKEKLAANEVPSQVIPSPPTKEEKKESEEEVEFPIFAIGDIVYNKNTREKGVIVDVSRTAYAYIVRWENKPNPELVKQDVLTTESELYKPVDYRPETEQEKMEEAEEEKMIEELKSVPEEKEEFSYKTLQILKNVLTDPRVAPIVVEQLMESGELPVDDLSFILKQSGVNAPVILNHLVEKSLIPDDKIVEFMREII